MGRRGNLPVQSLMLHSVSIDDTRRLLFIHTQWQVLKKYGCPAGQPYSYFLFSFRFTNPITLSPQSNTRWTAKNTVGVIISNTIPTSVLA